MFIIYWLWSVWLKHAVFFQQRLAQFDLSQPKRLDTFQRPMQHKGIWKPRMPRLHVRPQNHPEFMFQHMSYFIIIFMSPPSSAKSLDDGLCFRSLVCILLDCVENSTILSGGCQSSDGLLQQMEWMSLSSNVCGMLWTSVEFCGSVCWPRLSQKPSDSDLDGFCCWVAEEEVIMKTHKA